MSGAARWSDLMPRILSAAVLLSVGIFAIWTGGWVFALLVWVLAGVMTWELVRMLVPERPETALGLGALVGLALMLAELPGMVASGVLLGILVVPLFGAAIIVGAGQLSAHRGFYGAVALAILLGCFTMGALRDQAGVAWLLWVIFVVIASDVAGYFAGKTIGGKKFWPSISPKKTWSGTVAGWVGAAFIGACFSGITGAGAVLIPLSVLVGFAGQMGDIAESAIKRRMGVKDSSTLIPGHGGFLDRFDAMLGASLMVGVLWIAGWLPGL